MKTSWTALLVIALLDPVTATCKSACQSQLVHFREDACQKWRDQLPRPDLFNHCGQGFNRGKTAGCEGFCEKTPDLGSMKSMRLDACSSLKGVPPMERQQACQAGFSEALDLAKDAAVHDADKPQHDADSHPHQDSSSSQSNQGGQEAGAPGRKLEAEAASEPTGELKIKKVIKPDRRNLLDDARKEAENAFSNPEELKIEL